MMTNHVETPTLKQMRERSGKSLKDVAEQMSQLLEKPIPQQYISVIEFRGTGMYDYIQAFSEIYRVPMAVVAKAAKPALKNISKSI